MEEVVNKYILLLRGVNVGSKNLLPMKDLKIFLEECGFNDVKTYIRSGNIVLLSTANPEVKIRELILAKFGFLPEVIVLSESEFNSTVVANPYQEYEGKFVHFYFCKTTPKINSAKLEASLSETERYTVVGSVFYLHAPSGIGRSKLVANIEACLGVPATGRNLNTINKLNEIVRNG